MKKYFLIFGLFFLRFIPVSSAADFKPLAIIPGLHLGYIFNAGISFGAELNYSPFVFQTGKMQTATGVYGAFTYFYSKGELYTSTWYHTFSAGGMAFTDNRFMLKAGACKSVLRWGRSNLNKTKSKSITPDLDLSYAPFRNSLFFGYRIYFPGNACFGLDIDTAHMLYVACRYNVGRAGE